MSDGVLNARLRRFLLPLLLPVPVLVSACATVVSDDYSPEFSGDFIVTDDSGDQELAHKVLKVDLRKGWGSVTPSEGARPQVWLSRCRSQIGHFGYGDQGRDVHEMWCMGSDNFSYLFIHGKPGLEAPEALMLKMFKDRHDVRSDSGYLLRRYIPNMITVTYALDRKQ